ncbi:MAG: ribose 5-phosphate isomerase B [Planctomycetes bacterium]|nr:ribose 5-phosphate isomerase B [Planctomycetota bacterium]
MSEPASASSPHPTRRGGDGDENGRSGRRRDLVTEADVLAAHDEGRPLRIPEGALVTPAAQDAARLYRVPVLKLLRPAERGEVSGRPADACVVGPCRVALGADHGGFPLKQDLKAFLESAGHAVVDVGTWSTDAVDYPDFAYAVARAVAEGRCERGIVIDGAGIGSSIVANKVPGVRAANCRSLDEAKNSREHNDANVLSLGSRFVQPGDARELVRTWLSLPFGGGRHQRRIDKLLELEARHLRPLEDGPAPNERRVP